MHGLSEPADVTLLRVETCPSGRLATPICSCVVTPNGDASPFELAVPLATPPVVAGPHCRLSFAVRARSPVSGRRRGQVLVPVEISGGVRGVHETSLRHDRVIASFPARHFHIELADAVLEGGGQIQGRVHVADGATRAVEVIARCEESWRINFRFRHHRQPPLWRTEPLWHEDLTVECEPDRRWHPVRVHHPAGPADRRRGPHRVLAIRDRGPPPRPRRPGRAGRRHAAAVRRGVSRPGRPPLITGLCR